MMPLNAHTIPQGGSRRLSDRDVEIVELVGRFRIMTAEQVRAVIFTTQASKTPLDRTLGRLTAGGYLARLARMVGGLGGGSGCYVYQLGRKGWRLLGKGGAYRPLRTADLHTLTITECFVALHAQEQGGALRVITYQPEPSCHRTVGGVKLTPDAYVELGVPARRLKFCYLLEVDRDTENNDTLMGKCVRYWKAYKAWCDDEIFPDVVFVVPDTNRARAIERVIAGGPDEALALFRVYLLDDFAEVIHRNML
jgi:hypothetical protein